MTLGMGETMIFLRRATHVALLTLVVIPITAAITAPRAAAEPRKRSQAETAALARRMLAQLKVARPLSIRGYHRKRFQPRWAPHKGRCDTRETVLARDGRRVRRDAACHPVKGVWYSPYDGKRLKSEKRVDVDHVVPLAYAWRSGAKRWSQAKRRAFANDLTRPAHRQPLRQHRQRRPGPAELAPATPRPLVPVRRLLDHRETPLPALRDP
jgi:hypothetical protein